MESNSLLLQLHITQIAGYVQPILTHMVAGSVLAKSGKEKTLSLRMTILTGHPNISRQVGHKGDLHPRGNPR